MPLLALVTCATGACSGGGGTGGPGTSTSAAPVSTAAAPAPSAAPSATPTSAEAATTSTLPSTTTTAGLSAGDAPALLAGFDPGSDRADELVARRADPAVVAAATAVLEAGGSPWQLWAAVYVWANEGDAATPLMAYLESDDVAVRAMAAAGVLGRGEIAGFAPLIALLEDTDMVAGSEPPTPVWSFATTVLVSLTGDAGNGPPFDADASQRAAARARWLAWFETNRTTLHFDDGDGRWLT